MQCATRERIYYCTASAMCRWAQGLKNRAVHLSISLSLSTDDAPYVMYQMLLRNELLDGSTSTAAAVRAAPAALGSAAVSADSMVAVGTLGAAASPTSSGQQQQPGEGGAAGAAGHAAAAGREIRPSASRGTNENIMLQTLSGLPASVLGLSGSAAPASPLGTASPSRLTAYSLSPISAHSHKLLQAPMATPRRVPKAPFKVLDAPELEDDFYLNLMDWSSTNLLAVGLKHCVYLWSAVTTQVGRVFRIKVAGGWGWKGWICSEFSNRYNSLQQSSHTLQPPIPVSGDQTVRAELAGVLGKVDVVGVYAGCGQQQWRGAAVGCVQVPHAERVGRSRKPRGRHGLGR